MLNGNSKIIMPNLKFSSVFEANVKQAEEDARNKAKSFEAGEITDDSTPGSVSYEAIEVVDNMPGLDTGNIITVIKENESLKPKDVIKSHEVISYTDKIKSKSRSRSRSRSRRHKKDRKHSLSHSKDRNRKSHSRSRREVIDSSRHRRSNYNRDRRKERKSYRHNSYSRSRSRSQSYERSNNRSSRIDKKRLLAIARKNAIHMLNNGTLPGAVGLCPQAQEKVLAVIKSGGKSIDELTDFCKNLSQKESLGDLSILSSDDSEKNCADKAFHHPFLIKDRGAIVMNIKNSVPIPTRTLQEKTAEQSKTLTTLFPVSSGQFHRKTENEWVPVSPPRAICAPPIIKSKPNEPLAITQTASFTANKPKPAPISVVIPPSTLPDPNCMNALAITPLPQLSEPCNQVFNTDPNASYDVSTIISQRLLAMRRLQENPGDMGAMNDMFYSQQEMSAWAASKFQPGQFTGSTDANILTVKELQSGTQAWAKRNQLQVAAPVSGGMGMHLLQKMGWRPGEGLGKNKDGSLQPLLLEVKLDKKGLVSKDQSDQSPSKKSIQTVKTLAGKHPVSLLGEFASKRKLGVPQYELCFESGPDHKKNFLYKVCLNGMEYQPSVVSANKRQAKADAATLCLQQLGLL